MRQGEYTCSSLIKSKTGYESIESYQTQSAIATVRNCFFALTSDCWRTIWDMLIHIGKLLHLTVVVSKYQCHYSNLQSIIMDWKDSSCWNLLHVCLVHHGMESPQRIRSGYISMINLSTFTSEQLSIKQCWIAHFFIQLIKPSCYSHQTLLRRFCSLEVF